MTVSVLLYPYCLGVTSSRMTAKRLEEDAAFRVLAANNGPDFRKRHLGELAGLCVQVLRLCQKAGAWLTGPCMARWDEIEGEELYAYEA
jgi:transposase